MPFVGGCMVSVCETLIRWEHFRAWTEIKPLHRYVEQTLNTHVTFEEISRHLEIMESDELAERNPDGLWRVCEPDRPELQLYEQLGALLKKPDLLQQLGVQGSNFVLEETATVGTSDGRFSRPDFVLASIRRWKFDPQTSLEVFSFEVKNRQGANIPAVYEALAHARFVHHPFLVCPRTRLDVSLERQIKSTCEREGVGLILFDIKAVSQNPGFALLNLSVECTAARRSTDPAIVERFLEGRLSEVSNTRLQRLAEGAE